MARQPMSGTMNWAAGVWDPLYAGPELTIPSPNVDYRLDSCISIKYHEQPYAKVGQVDLNPPPVLESSLSPRQGLRIWAQIYAP
jgi:hypothetical protein